MAAGKVEHLAYQYGEYSAGNPIGILSEHVYYAERLGGSVASDVRDRLEYVHADGERWPVVCSEIIPIWTEDGRSDGRCGKLAADTEFGACFGHAADIRHWRSQTEAETIAWERAREVW